MKKLMNIVATTAVFGLGGTAAVASAETTRRGEEGT